MRLRYVLITILLMGILSWLLGQYVHRGTALYERLDAATLIFSCMGCMGVVAWCVSVLRHRIRLHRQWKDMPELGRKMFRIHDLLETPLIEHIAEQPDDLVHYFRIMRPKSGEVYTSVFCSDEAFMRNHETWDEKKIAALKTFAEGVVAFERHTPGAIGIVQVMLDEQRERIEEERAKALAQ